jgi:hypothetical protein
MERESNRLATRISDSSRKCSSIRLTDISPHANDASSETNHSTLATRASSTGPVWVPRIDSSSDDVIDGLTNHERLWYTGLDVKYSTSFTKQMREDRVFAVVLSEPADVAHVSLVTLCKVSIILGLS